MEAPTEKGTAEVPPPPTTDRFRIPWLALLGPALLVLSTSFAWTIELFTVPISAPIYATELSVPFLVSTRLFMTRVPTIAQGLAVIAVAASGMILVQARWAEILQRVLGACALILAGLFAWRLREMVETFGDTSGFLSVLRAGFYIGVVGGVLLILLPRSRRE